MHDLRLIGVHEDGQHLLLADDAGERYRVPLDESLRAAARRDRARLGQLQIEIEGGLTPREVQSLIRQGCTAEEVAERSGWTVEKVRRFEGPILAEREHMARRAQSCPLGTARDPETLGSRVADRLRSRGVAAHQVEWDSARDERGHWRVAVTFPAGGRSREAHWAFDQVGRTVAPLDDEARWLGEDAEAAPGTPAPPMLPPSGEETVYAVEGSGSLVERRRAHHEPIDLMAAMRDNSLRARRAAKRRSPSHPPGADRATEAVQAPEQLAVDLTLLGPPPNARDEDRLLDPEGEAELTASETVAAGAATDSADEPTDETTDGPVEQNESPAAPSAARRGRRAVPKWDDIVFGGRD